MELPQNELACFWQAYKKNNSDQAREKLILHYYSLVKYVAGRVKMIVPETWAFEDLVGYGILGLIEAVEKFDPARGVRFETYAISRIKGKIIDEIRSLQFVPRTIQDKARKLIEVQQDLENRLHRNPTDDELAEELGMTAGQFHQFLQEASYPQLLSLEFPLGNQEEVALKELISGNDDLEETVARKELIKILGEAIDSLPEKERLVLTLYYYEGLTLKEIGEVLDLSSARISQLHTKAIFRLRGKLGRKKSLLMGYG